MLHQIGVGALGPVFRTYEPTRDRLVAVKVFRLDVIPEQARALADELARAADAGLFHPSIVEPLAAGLEGTVAYRAEEYVAAESLDVAMRHYAPATVDKMLPFITQLASALDFARAAGVGHGALHPRDIFVTPDEARATGFGVVDALDRLGLRAPVRRPYSPPERIAGQPWSTPADVFSLGVIAFELLTGRRPSGLGAEMGPLTGATLGEHESEVRAVLARAMHAEPGERHASAQAFSAALSEAAGVAETPVSLAPRAIAPPVKSSTEATPGPSAESEPLTSDDDLALDDFAAESEVPSLSGSPREMARKVIAAREVRKRQVKKKTPESAPDLISGLTADAMPDITPDTRVDISKDDDASPPAKVVALGVEPLAVPAVESPGARVEPMIVPIIGASVSTPADAVSAAPLLEAVELTPVRDLSERVVAVDEFRAREAASSKPERPWPRVPERPVLEKPLDIQRPEMERAVPDRSEWVATTRLGAPSILSAPVPSVIDSPLAAEGLPATFGESLPEPHRIDMLQRTLLVGLGLVLGFAAGYFVANREKAPTVAGAATAASPPASPGTQIPTTGTVPAPGDSTVVVLPPAVVPSNPTEGVSPKSSAPAIAPPARPATSEPAPRAAKPVATTGRIVVTSSPAKAAVTINGKWSGRTPLTVDDLKFGTYVVRVVQSGYEVARREVALSTASPSGAFDPTLRPLKAPARTPAPEARAPQAQPPASPPKPPAATTGEIYVDSRPRGARVFIDGKEVGVTPLQLTAQPLGPRVVRLELADHQSWTETKTVVAGDVARITGSLDRIR